MEQADTQVWLGSGKHVVFYPLRNHEQFNLVFMFVTLNLSYLLARGLADGTTVSQTKVQQRCLKPSTRYKNCGQISKTGIPCKLSLHRERLVSKSDELQLNADN